MRILRRLLVVLGLAGALRWVLRRRSRGAATAPTGGWRQLHEPDFR